jgi:ribosomal protein S18 acetylase RimI-like enzyme
MKYREIDVASEKSTVCGSVLRALPDWFGIEESIRDYVSDVFGMKMWAVFDGDKAIGFCALNVHYKSSAEIHVMGILAEYHRRGIGREFVRLCEDFCAENGHEFLSVKTLDSSHPDKYYARTREFYLSMGFKNLELFKTLWGESNPCLMLIKHINTR